MIFKNNPFVFGLALAVLFTTQTYTQEIPELVTTKKRTFAYRVGEKLNINAHDIAQGAAIGSVLFGSSFLVQDPKLKLALRVLACAPMIFGIFAPKKILNKVSKLELDEARCSNYKCTGVCTECRVTKLYIASTLIMIPLYGIRWMFKKPATPAIPVAPQAPLVPAAPEQEPAPAPLVEQEPIRVPVVPAQEPVPAPIVVAPNNEQPDEQQEAPQNELLEQQNAIAQDNADAQNDTSDKETEDDDASTQDSDGDQPAEQPEEQQVPEPAQSQGLMGRFNDGLAWLLLGNE